VFRFKLRTMDAFRRVPSWVASQRLRLVTLTAALICIEFGVLSPPRASAYCRLTTEMSTPGDTCARTGAGLFWERPCISFSMTDRRRTDPPLETLRDIAEVSFDSWLAVTCDGQRVGLEIRQTEALGECTTPEYNLNAANANTVIFVSDWAQRKLPQDAFGLTLVWHHPDTGEIHDADMQINETLGALAVCNGTCPAGSVDLQNVITHEAGHFLGLGHSDDTRATMAARAQVGEIRKRDLADDDRAGLCDIYGELPAQACDAFAFEPDRGFSPMCMPPAQARTATSRCSVEHVAPGKPSGMLLWLGTIAALTALRLRRRRALR
jgi:hypothetical protein